MATTLMDLLNNLNNISKKDVAKLHDENTSPEEKEKILEALQTDGYENLPD